MKIKQQRKTINLFWLVFTVGLSIAVSGPEVVRAAEHTISLVDRPPYVEPLNLEIEVGDTVKWENQGPEMVHTVTDRDMMLFSDDIVVDAGWEYTYQKAGVYPYVCFRHNFMRGTVTVRNPDGSTDSEPDFPYQKAFKEYVIPTNKAVPRMIIASKVDDSVWFTEGGGGFYGFEEFPPQNKVAQLWEDGTIIEYATPTPGGKGSDVGVDSLVMDEEGTIWFTERLTNRIGRLDSDGSIIEYDIPTEEGYALGIDLDRQGRLWFAERYGNRIGWMSKEGEFTEVELPEEDSEPRTVFVDSKSRVWYTARTANEIGFYESLQKEPIRLKIPTELARPTGIAETSDGSIYFVEMVGNKIARVKGEQIVEYPLPTAFAAPFKIVADRDDNLWFTEVFGNAIGKLDSRTGRITEYKIPTLDSRPGGIAVDRKGRIWFTEQTGNKIGMLDPAVLETLGEEESETAVAEQEIEEEVEPEAETVAWSIEDFEVPTATSGPGNALIEGGDGTLWFNQVYGNQVAGFDPQTGEFEEFPLLTPASMPVGLAMDPGGVLWATEFRGNRLARVDPTSGEVKEYPLPSLGALPAGITADETGTIWFAQLGANSIVAFRPDLESFTQYPLPIEDSSPLMIAADRRGALWVTASEGNGNYLARFDRQQESFEMFELPTSDASPIGLLIDQEFVWVAEGGGGKLARFEIATQKWKEFEIPAEKSEPVNLAKDHAGYIWLTDGGGLGEYGGNRVARFDPAAELFDLIPMRQEKAKPRGILAASDGHIWITQQEANLLSKIYLSQ